MAESLHSYLSVIVGKTHHRCCQSGPSEAQDLSRGRRKFVIQGQQAIIFSGWQHATQQKFVA
jgi:hypothetical protein